MSGAHRSFIDVSEASSRFVIRLNCLQDKPKLTNQFRVNANRISHPGATLAEPRLKPESYSNKAILKAGE